MFSNLKRASSLPLLACFLTSCYASDNVLSPRSTTVPAPLSIPPAQNWEGIDGLWNTFALQIGTPAQTVRVMISTASQQTWAVAPIGCSGMNQTICDQSRGGDYDPNASSTWTKQGGYKLYVEQNLGFNGEQDIGTFGYDTVKVGYQGEGGPSLQNQVVGIFSTYDFYYGHFGINPKPTNWSDFNNPYPSFLTNLKNQSMIPSVSWGYTAGAYYRQAHVLSSLTLGGYDAGRFAPNNVSWNLGSNNERDVLVAIQDITSSSSNARTESLIPKTFTSPVYSYIDSTVAEIWLPKAICDVFAQTYNLTYNSSTDLYYVTDAAHQQLLASNPTITFSLGASPQGGQTVQIALPYAAFDLTAQAPYQGLTGAQRYFPLRRAANDTQYTLGRTFLQEAYLTVDWERGNFSVSQCVWPDAGITQYIRAIDSPNKASNVVPGSAISAGVIVAIVAVIVAILLIAATIIFCMRRRRQRQRKSNAAAKASMDDMTTTLKSIDSESGTLVEPKSNVLPKVELDASQTPKEYGDGTYFDPNKSPVDSDGSYTWVNPVEVDSKEREIFEMPGDYPKMPEADSRQFSEKEAMRAREAQFNGVDTMSPVSPASPDADTRTQRSPVSPSDVVEVIHRVGTRNTRGNPVSPIDGSTGSRTMLFSPLSPLDGTVMNISPTTVSAGRRRFSYELDEEEQQAQAGASQGSIEPENK